MTSASQGRTNDLIGWFGRRSSVGYSNFVGFFTWVIHCYDSKPLWTNPVLLIIDVLISQGDICLEWAIIGDLEAYAALTASMGFSYNFY